MLTLNLLCDKIHVRGILEDLVKLDDVRVVHLLQNLDSASKLLGILDLLLVYLLNRTPGLILY